MKPEDALEATQARPTPAPVAQDTRLRKPPEPQIPGHTLVRTTDGLARVFVRNDDGRSQHVSDYDPLAGM